MGRPAARRADNGQPVRPGAGGDAGGLAGGQNALFFAHCAGRAVGSLAFQSRRADSIGVVDGLDADDARRAAVSVALAAGRVGWLGIGMTVWLVSGAVMLW